MKEEAEPYAPRLAVAIDLFNRHEFFACHDVLEELWAEAIGPQRDFLQGLIHAAVALHHFTEGNLGGARKMHDSAVRYLAASPADGGGIDLDRFRVDFDRCFAPLLGVHAAYPADVVIDPALIPQWRRREESRP